MMDEVQKMKTVSVNVSRALVSIFIYKRRYGHVRLGLDWHSPVESNPVWCGQVQQFICKFKIIAYI
jgi:hypothetical protein